MERGDKATILEALDEARTRTRMLADAFTEEDLLEPAADYLSPPCWDLGHIGNFEELWLVQRLLDAPELRAGYNDIYDAFRHPRAERPQLELLDRQGCQEYQDEVRARVAAILANTDTGPDAPRLTRDGFVHWMLVLHEHQHQETLLQSLAMRGPARTSLPPPRALPEPGALDSPWVDIPAGTCTMGRTQGPGVYDNESPPCAVEVEPFAMARYPVTCGEYLAFIEDGGYTKPAFWSPRGQAWLEEGHQAPLYWFRRDGQWWRRDLRGESTILEAYDEILCHVTYWEAEAYAKWRDARLPTEAEWEHAARFGGRWNPWGDAPATPEMANVDQTAWGPSRIGAYPEGRSALGVEHMIGDVWEWCSSGFEPYPGFEAYPYDAYSKVFFGGDYKMLRGGAWSARAGCAHATFRNWDHPYRRQIFSGIRLAKDGA